MDFSIFRGPGTVEISLKNCFYYSKSSKNMLFRHQIALKPAKMCSTRDFDIRKQYGDRTRNSKKIMDFSIFRCPGTVEISLSNTLKI